MKGKKKSAGEAKRAGKEQEGARRAGRKAGARLEPRLCGPRGRPGQTWLGLVHAGPDDDVKRVHQWALSHRENKKTQKEIK